eukprot:Gb_20978 [translate_table: standard]
MEFMSRPSAEKVLQMYNGTPMPNTEQPFRLNWASFSMGERRSDASPDHSIFVGDLASDVTDLVLQETFQSRYPSVKGAKVVTDSNTGRSKGYGFVRFGDENERARAMTEMNGVYCSTRPMRISAATPRKSAGFQQQYSAKGVILLSKALGLCHTPAVTVCCIYSILSRWAVFDVVVKVTTGILMLNTCAILLLQLGFVVFAFLQVTRIVAAVANAFSV